MKECCFVRENEVVSSRPIATVPSLYPIGSVYISIYLFNIIKLGSVYFCKLH